MVAFESLLERDFLKLLEFDETISDVLEQPFTLEYTNEKGKPAIYTPDFFVERSAKGYAGFGRIRPSMIIEVKPREVLMNRFNEFRPKFKAAIAYARSCGYIFKIFDESRIRTPFLQAANQMKRFANYQYEPFYEERILRSLKLYGHQRVDHLLAENFPTEDMKRIAWGNVLGLLGRRVLACNMREEPLSMKSVVWINEEQDS